MSSFTIRGWPNASGDSAGRATHRARSVEHGDLMGAVGKTPVVQLLNLRPHPASTLLLKLESLNPGGSIKDRPAAHIIAEAERAGKLRPGGTIIESSSGNFGISLAMLGAMRGYRVMILVDPKTTRTNIGMLQARGAEVVVVTEKDEAGGYHRSRIRRANELAREIEGSYRPDQCSNPLNAEAHYLSTGREILESTAGELDMVVVPTSTGGQIAGISRFLREHAPHIKIIAADVRGSSIFTRQGHPYYTAGMGMAWTPINVRYQDIDAAHLVHDEDACAGARLLTRVDGLCAGASTGTVLSVMLYYAQHRPGARILGILSDSGDRYLETIYSDSWAVERGLRTDIEEAEYFERCRRLAPLPREAWEYVEADPRLVPADWLKAALSRRNS